MSSLAWLVVIAVPSPSSAAPSDDAVEPIVFSYEAEGACPSKTEFIDMVRAYTTRWSPVSDGTTMARAIRVRASAESPGGTGTLTLTGTSGKRSEREVVGPSCEAVSQALAIMVAVAIDPHAFSAVSPEPLPQLPPPERPPPAPSPPTPRPEVGGVVAPPAPSLAPAPASEPSVQWSSDVRSELTNAVIAAALPGLGISVEIEPSLGKDAVPSWFKPALAVGFRQSLATEVGARVGSVEFLWRAGNVRLCPLRFSFHDRLVDISLCVETNIGRLNARAEGFRQTGPSAIPWVDVGGSTWMAVRLTKHAFLSTTVDVIAPQSRRRFELSDGALVSRAPAVGVLGGLGLGIHF